MDERPDLIQALPVGRLKYETVRRIIIGRKEHRRSGPWVPVAVGDAYLVSIVRVQEQS